MECSRQNIHMTNAKLVWTNFIAIQNYKVMVHKVVALEKEDIQPPRDNSFIRKDYRTSTESSWKSIEQIMLATTQSQINQAPFIHPNIEKYPSHNHQRVQIREHSQHDKDKTRWYHKRNNTKPKGKQNQIEKDMVSLINHHINSAKITLKTEAPIIPYPRDAKPQHIYASGHTNQKRRRALKPRTHTQPIPKITTYII